MSILLLTTIASGLVVLLCLLLLLKQWRVRDNDSAPVPQERGNEGARPRRAVAIRNQRARLRAAGGNDLDEENETKVETDISDKVGAKKRAKLEAKAEKKAQREAEVKAREEKKKRLEQEEEERQKNAELAQKEQEKLLEEERKALLEKERQEQEEYMKMKALFSVEEEGFDEECSEDSETHLLREFIDHIKRSKVVVLEDLAATFKLKTQNVIDRITELQNDGVLTGVIDDRGKFIYISEEELTAIAKFVKQRGRVSITELAECSNQLINLNPRMTVTAQN